MTVTDVDAAPIFEPEQPADYDVFRSRTIPAREPAANPRLLISGGSPGSAVLTIAIPTYKRPGLLFEALLSVKRQTAQPDTFEVIVIDNDPEGDDHAAFEMMSQLGLQNFSYYRNGRNIGMFGNWNRCLELANCDRLTILNDDDELAPAFVETMTALLDGRSKSLLTCESKVRTDDKAEAGSRSGFKDSAIKRLVMRLREGRLRHRTLRDYYFGNRNSGSLGVVMNRQCALDIGGFDETSYPSADFYFFCQYVHLHGETHLYRRLTVYRVGYNDSLNTPVTTKFVLQSYVLRRYLAQSILKSRVLAALPGAFSVMEMKVSKRLWGAALDEGAILRNLGIHRWLNNRVVAHTVWLMVFVREVLIDAVLTRSWRDESSKR